LVLERLRRRGNVGIGSYNLVIFIPDRPLGSKKEEKRREEKEEKRKSQTNFHSFAANQ